MTVDRTLIIPMFNESMRIAATLRALAASPLHGPDTEILLVDDGSTDDTTAVAERLIDELGLAAQVVRLTRNVGKGGAVRAGVAASRGTAVAFVDADLSAAPDAVVSCFEHIEAGKADIVVTTRVHPESLITELPPATRRYGGKIFNTLLRGLGLTDMSDTQCGLKAFTSEAAERLFSGLRVQGFAFDVEVLQRATREGFSILELPIEWHHVEASRVRPVRDGLRMALDAVRIRARMRPGPKRVPAGMRSMDDDRFPVMARLERDHWWFRAKRTLVLDELRRHGGVPSGASADFGCGTGAMVTDLLDAGFATSVGTDLSPSALAFAAGANDAAWATSRAEHLPFADGSFRAVTSLDVIEHLDDDVAGLREYRRVVAAGGLVVVSVPAYAWAWSDHDVALGHRRRYTRRALRQSLEAAGLRVERITYFHSWLVPPALLLRRTPLRRVLRGSAEEASFVGPRVNRFLRGVAETERWMLRRVDLPFGLSVLATARR